MVVNGSPVRRGRSRSSVSGATSNNASNQNSNITLWKLLLLELNIETKNVDHHSDDDKIESDISMIQLVNIVKIPVYLEKFMIFGLMYCTNAFLTLLTITPLRLMMNICLMVRSFFISKRLEYIKLNSLVLKKDAIFGFCLVTTLIILKNLDTSKIYHNIKNGTAIKLYVMMGILEVADKLFSSLGQDLLNILFNLQISFKNTAKFLIILTCSIGYLFCHSYIFIYQIMSLTVAINSYSNALLTLILSAQFSELKSSVFKKFEREGLFQITCADLTERFQLFTILFVISLKNLNIENTTMSSLKPNSWYLNSSNYINIWFGIIMGPTFVVIGSEILVDWLKHLYITKFNKIKPSIYDKYLRVLSIDYMESYNFNNTNSNMQNNLDGILLVKRVGLPLLTMIIVFVKMSIIPLCISIYNEFQFIAGMLLIISIFMTTLFVRLILSLVLLKWSNSVLISKRHHRNDFIPGPASTSLVELSNSMRKQLYETNEKIPPSLEEMRKNEDDEKLKDVRRYEMASKRIW